MECRHRESEGGVKPNETKPVIVIDDPHLVITEERENNDALRTLFDIARVPAFIRVSRRRKKKPA